MSASARLFDDRLTREWIGFKLLRRFIAVAAIIHFSLAAASGYRAVVQVYRASVTTDTPALRAGSRISADIVTAGRTYVDVKIELLQGGRRATIATLQVPQNDSFFYDFRPKRAHFDVSLSRAVLDGFKAGPAFVRVVAEGRSQWLRTPPPKTDRVAVVLQ